MISVTQMHSGDAYNVIPQEAVLRGTIRAFRKETMALIKGRIETISSGIAQTLGGSAKADVRIAFPPLVNDKDAVKFIADVAAEIDGAGEHESGVGQPTTRRREQSPEPNKTWHGPC